MVRDNFKKEDMIVLTLFIFMSVLIIQRAYLSDIYISPDSANYLKAAQGLLDGNGFYYNKNAGDTATWFAIWPIGYPALIACVSLVTGTNVYMASKVLTLIFILAIFIFFKLRFREDAWIYSLSVGNKVFIIIFCYTWSEQPFILGMLWFSAALYDVFRNDDVKLGDYLNLTISAVFLFLMRYIGAFAVGIIGAAAGVLLAVQFASGFSEKKQVKKAAFLFCSAVVSGSGILMYLLVNLQKTGFTTGMQRLKAPETFFELLRALLKSGQQEILYAVLSFLGIAFAILTIAGFALRLRVTRDVFRGLKDYKNHQSLFFILTGAVYLAAIVYSRFTTHFDGFDYRLLYPATFLFVTGIVALIVEQMPSQAASLRAVVRPAHVIVSCVFIAGCLLFVAAGGKNFVKALFKNEKYKSETTGFSYRRAQAIEKYRNVPSGSAVLWMDKIAAFLRTDLLPVLPKSAPYFAPETTEELWERLKEKKSVYLDINQMNKYWENNPSLNAFFEKYKGVKEELVRIK